ncbi:MAG: radical SAM protein [Deltaproteobacteria bacterium]|jgi:radical SAM protein with 4Fe4S-binding SPASM domain|nr:radical SAM protein [Deltaproteobacteria bacterium]
MLTRLKRRLSFLPGRAAVPAVPLTPAFPGYICLETTNACNLRCRQCLYKGGTTGHYARKVTNMDTELAFLVLDQLQEYGCGVMLNGDGEALLHPQFHAIAGRAAQLRLPNVYFNTNGTLLSPAFTDALVAYFRGAVAISLDGFKESHERLRVGSSYETVIGHIEYLLGAVQSSGAEITVSVSYCNYDQPEGERGEFVKYWVERVDAVSVGEVYDEKYQMISRPLNIKEGQQRLRCGVPWETFIVRSDGSVVPCSNCFASADEALVVGDARKQSLPDIWRGEKFQAWRDRMAAGAYTGTVCETCGRWAMYVLLPDEIQGDVKISRTGVFTTYRKTATQERLKDAGMAGR